MRLAKCKPEPVQTFARTGSVQESGAFSRWETPRTITKIQTVFLLNGVSTCVALSVSLSVVDVRGLYFTLHQVQQKQDSVV